MISLKNEIDIEEINEAGRIVRKVLNTLSEITESGLPTLEYDNVSEQITSSMNAVPAFKGYHGFPYSVCVSVNEEVVHGFPSKRRLKNGDIVSIDFGAYYKRYYADAAITVKVGDVSDVASRLMNVTKEALNLGIFMAMPGHRLNDISRAIEEHVVENHFSVVRDFVGHGVGFKLHEDPQVPNYYVKSNDVLLQEGLVIAIEPMVNELDCKVKIKQNGWTVVTKDRGLSAHFEHTVAITKDGPKILT